MHCGTPRCPSHVGCRLDLAPGAASLVWTVSMLHEGAGTEGPRSLGGTSRTHPRSNMKKTRDKVHKPTRSKQQQIVIVKKVQHGRVSDVPVTSKSDERNKKPPTETMKVLLTSVFRDEDSKLNLKVRAGTSCRASVRTSKPSVHGRSLQKHLTAKPPGGDNSPR